jgi:hypothetical protein
MASSKTITVQVSGLRECLATLQQLESRAPYAAAVLLKDFVETQVIAPAKELVPVDTGALRSTLQASEPIIAGTKISVEASAGGPAAPYALSVHENPRSGKTGGKSPSGKSYRNWARTGEWKFLERPALAAANTSGAWLAAAAKDLVARLKG